MAPMVPRDDTSVVDWYASPATLPIRIQTSRFRSARDVDLPKEISLMLSLTLKSGEIWLRASRVRCAEALGRPSITSSEICLAMLV